MCQPDTVHTLFEAAHFPCTLDTLDHWFCCSTSAVQKVHLSSRRSSPHRRASKTDQWGAAGSHASSNPTNRMASPGSFGRTLLDSSTTMTSFTNLLALMEETKENVLRTKSWLTTLQIKEDGSTAPLHFLEYRHRFWDEEKTGNSLVNTLAPVIGLCSRPFGVVLQGGKNSLNSKSSK